MDCRLSLQLDYDYVREPIQTRISLNEKILFEGNMEKTNWNFEVNAEEQNTLRIYLLNKKDGDTLVNKDGDIIKDTFIWVKSIMIDKRKLRSAINDISRIITDKGSEIKYATYLSQNGYYELRFELPIKNFLKRYYATWQTYKPVDVEKEIANIDRFLEDL